MGIEFTLETDLQFKSIVSELETLDKRIIKAMAREVIPPAERLLDRLIDSQLRIQPPKRQKGKRFKWSNDPAKDARARRWWFANNDQPYRRTGQLAKAWQGSINLTAERTITIEVINPANAAGYVYGSPAFGYQQVPSHNEQGWLSAGKAVPPVVLDTAVFIEAQTGDVVDREITRVLKSGKV